jgi:hypothetical protein
VARECDGPVTDAVKAVCPLQCRLRHGANPPSDEGSAGDQVDWAGFPINLDFAFSDVQRDNVYLQHLRRMREAQLWRWSQNGAQPCACDIAADLAHLDPDAAQDYVPS